MFEFTKRGLDQTCTVHIKAYGLNLYSSHKNLHVQLHFRLDIHSSRKGVFNKACTVHVKVSELDKHSSH